MTDEEKSQIRILRSEGYSYGRIAKMIGIKRDTVSSYCLRNQIKAPYKENCPGDPTEYRLCSYCHQLFPAKISKSQQFCSTKCRNDYWSRERHEAKMLEQKWDSLMTLQKELDFLGEQSDEWLDDEVKHLCRKKEITK